MNRGKEKGRSSLSGPRPFYVLLSVSDLYDWRDRMYVEGRMYVEICLCVSKKNGKEKKIICL